ncbi:hypothetical protein JKP88DRAFT_246330 [Tribonema minus]|uniref:Uncharacterized protein n=1 Tax=Tribonema minus TaxID=303371 RepID=A0A835Z2M3_9STRA|nr:hypothetical protein JKP88DRAFT_246330 [Tribonema minus]
MSGSMQHGKATGNKYHDVCNNPWNAQPSAVPDTYSGGTIPLKLRQSATLTPSATNGLSAFNFSPTFSAPMNGSVITGTVISSWGVGVPLDDMAALTAQFKFLRFVSVGVCVSYIGQESTAAGEILLVPLTGISATVTAGEVSTTISDWRDYSGASSMAKPTPPNQIAMDYTARRLPAARVSNAGMEDVIVKSAIRTTTGRAATLNRARARPAKPTASKYSKYNPMPQVPWVLELAQHLLDDHANLYDCFNLETLAHLIAYVETPVRQQDVWGNRSSLVHAKVIKYHSYCINLHLMRCAVDDALTQTIATLCNSLMQTIDDPTNKKTAGRTKVRTGHLNGPLPTTIPLPPGLTRMYLVVLFVCRSMRMLWQRSTKSPDAPVPDRIIGLAGSSNKVLGSKTFTEVIRKLGMCHFAIPKWGPYSIRNDFVTAIFREAYSAHHTGGGHGAAQELLGGRMNDIHSSLDAAISNYSQWVRNAHTSFLHPPKSSDVNNGGRYGSTTNSDGTTAADVGDDTHRFRRGAGGPGVDPTIAALLVQMKEQNEHHSKQ